MFTPRPQGVTLRRVEEYLHSPHDPSERMDPDFRVAMRCGDCGKLAYGPRSLMRGAIEEHKRSECSARKTKPGPVTEIYFPRC